MTDWRASAACADMDPREFDDQGTPAAWMTCDVCPVKADCLADAIANRAAGVYRAGVAFPEMGKAPGGCDRCGRPMQRGRRRALKRLLPGRVWHHGGGLCEACHAFERRAGVAS